MPIMLLENIAKFKDIIRNFVKIFKNLEKQKFKQNQNQLNNF